MAVSRDSTTMPTLSIRLSVILCSYAVAGAPGSFSSEPQNCYIGLISKRPTACVCVAPCKGLVGEPTNETEPNSLLESSSKRGAHQPSGAPTHDGPIMFQRGTGASSENAAQRPRGCSSRVGLC